MLTLEFFPVWNELNHTIASLENIVFELELEDWEVKTDDIAVSPTSPALAGTRTALEILRGSRKNLKQQIEQHIAEQEEQ